MRIFLYEILIDILGRVRMVLIVCMEASIMGIEIMEGFFYWSF